MAVDTKSNETWALSELLDMLELAGMIVTADAMHARRAASDLIIGKGGDCVLTMKSNQGSLHKDAKNWLEDLGNAEKMLSHQEFGRGHGRKETRTYIMGAGKGLPGSS